MFESSQDEIEEAVDFAKGNSDDEDSKYVSEDRIKAIRPFRYMEFVADLDQGLPIQGEDTSRSELEKEISADDGDISHLSQGMQQNKFSSSIQSPSIVFSSSCYSDGNQYTERVQGYYQSKDKETLEEPAEVEPLVMGPNISESVKETDPGSFDEIEERYLDQTSQLPKKPAGVETFNRREMKKLKKK